MNGDDERLYALKGKRPERIEYFGFQDHNDGRILSAELTGDLKLHVTAQYQGEIWEVSVNTLGQHMAMNIMPAIMTGVFLGLSREEIIRGLSTYEPASGRLHLRKGKKAAIIDDCYNASPDSMEAALTTLSRVPMEQAGRRVGILGDMYELGAMEEEGHRQVGRFADGLGLDRIITVGLLAKRIAEEIHQTKHVHFDTVDALLEALDSLIEEGDLVLVKASRGLHLEQVVNKLL